MKLIIKIIGTKAERQGFLKEIKKIKIKGIKVKINKNIVRATNETK